MTATSRLTTASLAPLALLALLAGGALLAGCAAPAGQHAARAHAGHAATEDRRLLVAFPDLMRTHTLANMRDHLLALAEIQAYLAEGAFDKASDTAEQRLGMSSLQLHGAHDVAGFMPAGMQAAGTAMHRSASRFAIAARDASATGDNKPALAALARLTQTCVGCHAAYRIQ